MRNELALYDEAALIGTCTDSYQPAQARI